MFPRDFPLDQFQLDAAAAIADGANVLVAAPTGSGKTVVAELAIEAAVAAGTKCFYTAPIKALSNQKYNDLCAVLGDERVGLLTGDHTIRADAPVVVMTTEVLRNMVYAGADVLHELGWVVLDEVHFLQDAYRGPVWEEVLIHTPRHVRFACLSATVSNSDELGDWIADLRGPTRTVVEFRRPVTLEPLLMVGDRSTGEEHVVALLVDGRPNPKGHRYDADTAGSDSARSGAASGSRRRGAPRRSRFYTPRRVETIERLAELSLLPTIYFIFSRNGCDEAAQRCVDFGLRLTSSAERTRIRELLEQHTDSLSAADLEVLGYDRWASGIESGVASHHAGMIPAYREAVEACFNEGLIKAVFATETLALGINMPARSVVIERLSKFNGETHEFLSPGQFTQLTGRAGRRGIDDHGSAVVLWSPFVGFDQVAQLAASRSFPLTSSFKPSYNMAANLVARYDRDRAYEVLTRSFAQFQADRAVVRLHARADRLAMEIREADPDAPGPDIADEVFDVAGYVELRDRQRVARRAQRSGGATERALAALRPGDVVDTGHRGGPIVVLAVSQRRGGTVRVRATSARGDLISLEASKLREAPTTITRIRLPTPLRPQDAKFRRRAATALRSTDTSGLQRSGARRSTQPGDGTAAELQRIKTALEAHPLHDHPDRETLIRAHAGRTRQQRELERIRADAERRGSGLVRRFEHVLEVLRSTGHLVEAPEEDIDPAGQPAQFTWALSPQGERLRRLYHECDLLISLCLADGLLDGLTQPEVAAVVSMFTHEHRSKDDPPPPTFPSAEVDARHRRIMSTHRQLRAIEERAGVTATREPQPGFAGDAWSWASGQPLQMIIDEDLTGGDFVRNIRQLVDLLRQLGDVVDSAATARNCRAAADVLQRGVVLAAGGPQ